MRYLHSLWLPIVFAACSPNNGPPEKATHVDIPPDMELRGGPATTSMNPPGQNPPQNPGKNPPSSGDIAPAVPGAPTPPPATTAVYGSMYYAGVPGDGVVWMSWPTQQTRNAANIGTVLPDVIDHLPSSYGNQYDNQDPVAWAHQTSHGISTELRTNHSPSGQRANGFYVTGDKAAIVTEPNITKSQVANFVPSILQGSRYPTYVTGQTQWENTPSYIVDEWVALTNGGATGVDLETRGLWRGGFEDAVAGPLELTVYSLAFAMAVEQGDPQYFQSNTQFREFLAFHAKRAMAVYAQGSKMPDFGFQDEDTYFANLKNDQSADAMRSFARRVFGQAFADTFVFGTAGGASGPDADADGVADSSDLCSGSPAGATVWTTGEWTGCAEGQHLDPPMIPNDGDRDGVVDDQDLCHQTPYGHPVWTSGVWIGCAEGESKR